MASKKLTLSKSTYKMVHKQHHLVTYCRPVSKVSQHHVSNVVVVLQCSIIINKASKLKGLNRQVKMYGLIIEYAHTTKKRYNE